MALNGNFSGKTSNQFVKPTIYWSAVQNLLENYSDITVELRYSRTNTGYTTEGNFSGALYIDKGTDGEQKQTGSKSSFKVTYKSNSLAMSKTFRVNHSSNGSKKITISATGSIPPSSVTSTTISQEVELDTIPRASTIGATDANIGATSMVVVTKKNTSYKHSVAYRFGALSGYIKADGTATGSEVIFSETSIAFALPNDFYAQIPKAKSGKCTLTCKTYYGNTQVGEDQTVTFTAVAAESVCAPNVSGTVVDTNETTKALTGDTNVLVRYHSEAKCTISASAKNAATLASKTVNGKAISNTSEISNAETGSFTFGVTDSRGYTATKKVTKNLIPYVKLTANAAVKRTDPTSGRAILTVKGNYFAGNFGTAKNTLTLSYRVGSGETVALTPTFSGNTYSATAELEGLAYDRSFPVDISAEDRLEQVHANVTVAKGVPTFEWGEGDFQFHVPVTFNGGIKDRNIKTYFNLSQLGLSGGVTTDAVFSAMPTWSMAVITNSKTSGNYLTDRPTDYCNVVLFKSNADYGSGIATKVNSSAKETYVFDWYNGYSHNGWTEISKAADNMVKTYSNLSQLGLSGGVTTDAVFSAMPTWSMAVITNSKTSGNYLTDRPTDYCNVVLFKSNADYGSGIATKVNSSAKETYVFDWYNGGSANAWTPVGDVVMRKLWENGKPTSSYPATTETPTGYGDYEAALVCARLSTSTANELPPVLIRKGGSAANIYGVSGGCFARRAVSFTDSGIVFEEAGKIASYSGTYAGNDALIIPTIIYGVKGVN